MILNRYKSTLLVVVIVLSLSHGYSQNTLETHRPIYAISISNNRLFSEKDDLLVLHPIKFSKSKSNFPSLAIPDENIVGINLNLSENPPLPNTELSEKFTAQFSHVGSYRPCLVMYKFRKKD